MSQIPTETCPYYCPVRNQWCPNDCFACEPAPTWVAVAMADVRKRARLIEALDAGSFSPEVRSEAMNLLETRGYHFALAWVREQAKLHCVQSM